MDIAIRADGGQNIGMGHIMRTLVLAKELRKKHNVFYICRIDEPMSEKYKKGIETIKKNGFEVKTIKEKMILYDLKAINADMLITDSYEVDESYFNKTKELFHKTVYIDDMNLYYFNVDFIINQNINAVDFSYKTNPSTKLLLGTKYVLLREEFSGALNKQIRDRVKDIMITVGGADPMQVTEKILDYVESLEYSFHVIVGPSFNQNNRLKDYEKDNIELHYNADMKDIMNKCDIAISACGSTLYELAIMGVPTLGIIMADNQSELARKMDEIGIIKKFGWCNELEKNKFVSNLICLCNDLELRKSMSAAAIETVDGMGVKRIVEILEG